MSRAPERSRRWLAWLPVLVVMGAIFALSAQPGLRVSDDVAVDQPFRITGHLLAYATLAALALVALSWGRRPRLRDAAIAFGISLVYALSDELHQSFVPDRAGRLDDVVVDALGALVGLVVGWLALALAALRRERRAGGAP
ncbi:MAG: VanZ family protein [Candidatus Limnocylindrales bacterium]